MCQDMSICMNVLAKASKIISVMLMEKIILHTTYEYYEYECYCDSHFYQNDALYVGHF